MKRLVIILLISLATNISHAASECPEDIQKLGAAGEWCEDDAYDRARIAADKELNIIYKRLISSIQSADRLNSNYNDEAISELREAQRAWLVYFEKHCGSGYTILTVGSPSTRMTSLQKCRYTKIKERINELKTLHNWSESTK